MKNETMYSVSGFKSPAIDCLRVLKRGSAPSSSISSGASKRVPFKIDLFSRPARAISLRAASTLSRYLSDAAFIGS